MNLSVKEIISFKLVDFTVNEFTCYSLIARMYTSLNPQNFIRESTFL